jgi:hypothetical protein
MHFFVCSMSPEIVSRGALYLLLCSGSICMTAFSFPLLSRITSGVSIIVGFFTVAPMNQLCTAWHLMTDSHVNTRRQSLFVPGTYSMVRFHDRTGDVLLLCATYCDKPLILQRGGCYIVVGMQYHMHPTPQTREYVASIPLST